MAQSKVQSRRQARKPIALAAIDTLRVQTLLAYPI
jgi:hypothetical protein